MQFQADCLRVPINCSDVEEASALGSSCNERNGSQDMDEL